jgi:hypothetical protein
LNHTGRVTPSIRPTLRGGLAILHPPLATLRSDVIGFFLIFLSVQVLLFGIESLQPVLQHLVLPPRSTKFFGISLVASSVFAGVGVVLFGIQRHDAAAAAAARGQGAERAARAAAHLGRLAAYLVAGGVLVCAVFGRLTDAIIERIDQAFAVFG